MEYPVNETVSYIISLTRHVSRGDIPGAILTVLIELGLQTHTEGFGYLRKAILLKTKNYDLRMNAIYQEIGRTSAYSRSPEQIEQAILATIETAWRYRERERWNYFFDEKRMGKRRKPTNKEFISQIASFMELWCSYCEEVGNGIK